MECLESLIPVVKNGYASIIVCDNHSTDGSETYIFNWISRYFKIDNLEDNVRKKGQTSALKAKFNKNSDLTFIQVGANLGYAGGNNVGIKFALNQERYDYIWIINNDVVIDKNALIFLCQCADSFPDVMVFGSTIVDYYDVQKVICAGGCYYYAALSYIINALGGKKLSSVLNYDKDINLDYISGAAFFVRTDIFYKVGLLNERYFLYFEEIDFIYQIKKIGYSIKWCRNSIVYHKGGVSTGGRSSANKRESWIANYFENINALRFTAKYYKRYLLLMAVFRFFGKIAAYILRSRMDLVSSLIAAYADFIRKRHPIIDKTAEQPRLILRGDLKPNMNF